MQLDDSAPSTSAVSWAAIIAGAMASAALSLILLVLGAGLGFSGMSPWAAHGATAETLGVSAIVWVSFVAIVASGTGGYLAGRLRVKWVGTHTDEVYFRDTAHGFLAWALATVASAALLTSAIGSIVGTGAQAGSALVGSAGAVTAASAGAMADGMNKPGTSRLGYFSDSLFRPSAASASASSPAATGSTAGDGTAAASNAEAGKIFVRGIESGSLAADDAQYLSQVVATRTGISPQDAQKRVSDTFAKAQASVQDAEAKAKETADKARKAGAYASLWLFFALLLGAFTASYAATVGGRQRDF